MATVVTGSRAAVTLPGSKIARIFMVPVAAPAATGVSFSPTGGVSATTVQTAIAELDTEKAPKANPTFTGNMTGQNVIMSGSMFQTSYQVATPTTGQTVTITAQDLRIYPAGTLANLTIALRGSPSDGDIQEIYFGKAVTTLTFSGGTIYDAAPASASAGQRLSLKYWAAATTWLLG